MIEHATSRRFKRRQFLSLALASTAAWPLVSRAQGSYPDRPIRVVVPFPAGGQTDIVARLFCQRAEALIKQPFIVDNRPGANTVIGSEAVARAAADGYTLLFTQTALVSNQVLMPKVPYDVFKDFTPVYRAYESAAVLASPPGGPKSLSEFISKAKSSNRPLIYGTAGHGSTSHFYAETLAKASGLTMNHVPYKGEPPILPDLMSSRLDVGVISTASAVQHGKEGKIQPLAITGSRRLRPLPDLPTFAEQGVQGMAMESYTGFYAPKQTPAAVVELLHAAFAKVSLQPDVNERLMANGLEVAPVISPAQIEAIMKKSYDEWVLVKKETGIQLE